MSCMVVSFAPVVDPQCSLEGRQGVPVLGFQCDKFPAFFSAKSPFNCPGRANTFAEVAKAFLAMEQVCANVRLVVCLFVGELSFVMCTQNKQRGA